MNNYTFDNMSRLGNDVVTLSETNTQNTLYGSYSVTNYFPNSCDRPLDFSTSQPNVFMTGGKNTVGNSGCVVNQNNDLRSMHTNTGGPIHLFTRPFVTIPYLGRGPYNIEQETALQQGDSISNRRSVNGLSEVSYIDNHHYPLIDSIRSKVTNPDNLVQKTPGGIPSRINKVKLDK